MLARLIEASLLQRLLVLVASCVLVGLGLQATGSCPLMPSRMSRPRRSRSSSRRRA
jgi:Cu/Ag efflux pump CusA